MPKVTVVKRSTPVFKTGWDKLQAELIDEGVNAFENENIVEEYLVLPAYLDELPSRELGRYLNAFIMQRMYVRSSISKLNAQLQEIESYLNREKARVFASLPAKMSVREKELNLYSDEVAGKILDKYNYFSNKYKFYLDYMESLEDAKFSISREISRRGLDFADNNRSDNIR